MDTGSCTTNCSVYSVTGYGSGGGNAGTSAIIRIGSTSGFASGCDAEAIATSSMFRRL